MKPSLRLLVSAGGAQRMDGVNVESEQCGRFRCPVQCDITYTPDGCAHNCNCGPYVRCPLVTCPARPPVCGVHTLLDGCQVCATSHPYHLSPYQILPVGRRVYVNFRMPCSTTHQTTHNQSNLQLFFSTKRTSHNKCAVISRASHDSYSRLCRHQYSWLENGRSAHVYNGYDACD
jgi:hypothetical protein